MLTRSLKTEEEQKLYQTCITIHITADMQSTALRQLVLHEDHRDFNFSC